MAEGFGAAVLRRRRELGWTQRQLAAAARVSPPWLCEVEKGQGGEISLAVALRLAHALGVTLGGLVGEVVPRGPALPPPAPRRGRPPKEKSEKSSE